MPFLVSKFKIRFLTIVDLILSQKVVLIIFWDVKETLSPSGGAMIAKKSIFGHFGPILGVKLETYISEHV
jgi:hypothetical protein